MPSRVSLIVLLGLIIVLVLSFGVSASAAPAENDEGEKADEAGVAQSELLRNQDELAQVQSDAAVAAEKYNSARSQVDQLNQNIAETVLKQADAEANFKKAQASLENQAVSVYKAGPLYLLDFLLSAESFSDFANRLWFSIKALLGMANEVEDWKKERNELEQIKVDLKANLDDQRQAADEAEAQRDTALNSAGELQKQIDSLSQDNSSSLPQDRIDAAQQLATDLDRLADSAPGMSPAEESAEQPVSFSPQAAEAIGIPEENTAALDPVLNNAVQAGDELQKAQQQEAGAAREVANQLTKSLPDPQDPPPSVTPRSILPGNSVASQSTPSKSVIPQSTPSNNTSNNSETPATSLPSVTQNPGLLKAAEEFKTAKQNADQAKQNTQNLGTKLADTLQQALQPITGAGTNSAGKATADNQKASTSNTSAKPSPTGGSALAAAASKVGAPYLWGSDGPNAFSCTGLVRYALRTAGIDPNAPMDVGGYYKYPRVTGEPQPGDVAIFGDGVGLYAGNGQVLMANEVDGRVGYYPVSNIGTPTYVRPGG